ncbi:MAG: hypothetical protein IJI21_07095 [Clostridia bacterium]|nr:hypothetical protein [Clostridia bacterium]
MSEESRIGFVDLEVNPETGKIREYGAFSPEGGNGSGGDCRPAAGCYPD